jgi:hypothetical protein
LLAIFLQGSVMRLAILLTAVALIGMSSAARAADEPIKIGGQSMMTDAKPAAEGRGSSIDNDLQQVAAACHNLTLTCNGDKSTATKCCPAGYQFHCPKASITCN